MTSKIEIQLFRVLIEFHMLRDGYYIHFEIDCCVEFRFRQQAVAIKYHKSYISFVSLTQKHYLKKFQLSFSVA